LQKLTLTKTNPTFSESSNSAPISRQRQMLIGGVALILIVMSFQVPTLGKLFFVVSDEEAK
jgi:hypothetical protein